MSAIRSAIRAAIRPAVRSVFGSSAVWSPSSLFAASEVGVWYDPSDLTTMFQDSAGTTPVTADGQTVGLILDKSQGLTIGADLATNGTFAADASWTKGTGWSIGSGVATKTAGSAGALAQTITSTATRWYKITATITRTAGTLTVSLGTSGSTAAFTASYTGSFYILAGSGTQTLSFSGDASFAGTVDNVVVTHIAGNHAYQSSASSRPLYKTSGGLSWLQFDGSDDFLVTSAIDFSATDEMSVFAGVRKSSDAAVGLLVELTNIDTTPGSFTVLAPAAIGEASYQVGCCTAAGRARYKVTTFSAPITNTLSCMYNLSAANAAAGINPLVNGAAATEAAVSSPWTGAGSTFANAALYIGRRGGASNPFSGNIYSLIARGSASSSDEITSAESYIAALSGVTL